MNDPERVERIIAALRDEKVDAVLCALPQHVLLLSGYSPVIGNSFCLATSDGRRVLLVPEDEEELAKLGHAEAVHTYHPTSLDSLATLAQAVASPLNNILREAHLACARMGYELGPFTQPATYSAMNFFGGGIVSLLRETVPATALAPADAMLASLAAVKTSREIECIRKSCEIAAQAFERGRAGLHIGLSEIEAAVLFRTPASVMGLQRSDTQRAGGFAWCMAGRNSAEARAAYARSRDTRLERHEFVLVHCNSAADGYWTDITRTYILGAPDERQLSLYDAVFSARAAALAAIRPGARAGDVDAAARQVLRSHGLDGAFPHSTGHGVGFGAISARDLPRIHPKSDDVLEEGMVFNVEPAVYFDGYGGLRHCDMVAVTATGVEVLTPFQGTKEELILHQAHGAR